MFRQLGVNRKSCGCSDNCSFCYLSQQSPRNSLVLGIRLSAASLSGMAHPCHSTKAFSTRLLVCSLIARTFSSKSCIQGWQCHTSPCELKATCLAQCEYLHPSEQKTDGQTHVGLALRAPHTSGSRKKPAQPCFQILNPTQCR